MKDRKINREEIIIKICKDEEKENCDPYLFKKQINKKKITEKILNPFQDITSLIVKKKDSDKKN